MSPEDRATLAALCEVGLECLDNLTSDEFAKGGDRPARKAFATILGLLGELDDETRHEYALHNVEGIAR